MEQLIKQESQKIVAKQMRQARIQRQIQVRQQTIAWTETNRKNFEEAKEREIKNLASAVTEDARNAAVRNIEYLTKLNDLAMADIGMAHRAAAGSKNIERLKSLKRVKDKEVAKNRGTSAMIKLVKENKSKTATSEAILKRKEEVRKAEDKKSKALISRKPLIPTNFKPESSTKVIGKPPEFEPALAKTLRVASVTNVQKGQSSEIKQIHPKPKSTSQKPRLSFSDKVQVKVSSSSDVMLHDNDNSSDAKKGALLKMVRIKTVDPTQYQRKNRPNSMDEEYGIGTLANALNLRNKYQPPQGETGNPTVVQPRTSTVRYFDLAVPKGEVKYVAPDGLVVKETTNSPDAWEKVKETTQKRIEDQERAAQKTNEFNQKASERGKLAMKRAKIDKEITALSNELLKGIDFDLLGTESQTGLLGLEDSNSTDGKENQQVYDDDDDEFSAVESGDEFEFPTTIPESTLKNYEIQRQLGQNIITLAPTKTLSTGSLSQDSVDSVATYNSSSSRHSSNDDEFRKYVLPPLIPASQPNTNEMSDLSETKNKASPTTTSSITATNLQNKDLNRQFTPPVSRKHHSQELNNEQNAPSTSSASSGSKSTLEKIALSMVSQRSKNSSLDSSAKSAKTGSIQSDISGSSSEKSGSGSTLAEVKVKTTADDTRVSTLEALQYKAKQQQEILLHHSRALPTTSKSRPKVDKRPRKNSGNNSDSRTPSFAHRAHESTAKSSSTNLSSSSDEIVILKARESTYSATSETSAGSTDYYIPPTPEGPFTSTPDGKLHPKRNSSDSDRSISEESLELLKRRTLYHYVSKFLTHRPESIEQLPVSTSTSSVIRADSDVLLSDSYEDTFGDSALENENSSNRTKKSTPNSTQTPSNHAYNVSGLATVSEEDSEMESGSTIAETAIKAGVTNAETSSSIDSPGTNRSSGNSDELPSSDSLSSMLKILSRHQITEKRQEEDGSQADLRENSSPNTSQSNNGDSSGNSAESSFPDASLLIRQLLSRNHQNLSGSSSSKSSPKSGPEKEADRLQLLDDITPVKLWDTPPQRQVHNQIEELSAVFEKLVAKWSNTRIEPPPWCDTLNSN